MIQPLDKGRLLNQQYEIVDLIGEGGNSYVYLVKHKDIGHLIIKECIYGLSDYKEIGQRMDCSIVVDEYWYDDNMHHASKEIQQLKMLREKGFAFYEASLSSFQENNTVYIPILNSMGTPLNQYEIKTCEDLYRVTFSLLKAIDSLHQKDLIHLDISPDNILITPYDNAFLIDFSSMKDIHHIDYDIACKEEYASKEVIERIYYRDNLYFESDEISYYSDIYSVGKVMLYLYDHCLNKKDYYKELEAYYHYALIASSKEAKDRYQSIDDLYELLDEKYHSMHYKSNKIREKVLNGAYKLYNEFHLSSHNQNIFYYKNRNKEFIGRIKEKEKLRRFEKNSSLFSYLCISGPSTAGKSSLVYSYIHDRILEDSLYKYIYLNAYELKQYDPYDLSHLGFHLMIVVDYISGNYLDIVEFLEKAIVMIGDYKLRVVFIEREYSNLDIPLWLSQLNTYSYQYKTLIDSQYYYGNLYLDSLDDSLLKELMRNFIHKEDIDDIYHQFLQQDPLKRPLFALMVALREVDESIDKNLDVLDYIVLKEKQRLRKICLKEHQDYDLWWKYYVEACLKGSLDFSLYDEDDHHLRNILNELNTYDHGYILEGIQIDLISEYFILDYFKDCRPSTIEEMILDAWKVNPEYIKTVLIHMENDFRYEYRKSLLNFKALYKPYIINHEYHDLLKQLSFSLDLKKHCERLLEQYYEYYQIDGRLLEYNGSSLELKVPNHIHTIKRLTGKNISSLKAVYLSESVKYIDEKAFYYNHSIEQLICKKRLVEIKKHAFYGCHRLKYITFNQGLKVIGEEAFYKTSLEYISLPDSLSYIGEKAFYNALNVKKLVIPKNIHHLNDETFKLSAIKHLVLGAIDYIGHSCFESCDIESLTYDSIKEIEYDSFKGNYIDESIFDSSIKKKDREIKELYKIHNYPIHLRSIVPFSEEYHLKDDIQCIDMFMINKNNELNNPVYLYLNDSLIEIGSRALAYRKIQSLIMPLSLKYIQSYAFNECRDLMNVSLNEGLISIGDYAFYKTALNQLILPSSLKHLGHFVIDYTQIKELQLPEGIETIGSFQYTKLDSLKIPKSVILNDVIYIRNNDELKSLILYENSIHQFPHIDHNKKLLYIQVILNKSIREYKKVNLICQSLKYPIRLKDKNICLLNIMEGNMKETYEHFIKDGFLYTLEKGG